MNATHTQELKLEMKWAPPLALKTALAFAAIYVIWGSTFLAIRYAIGSLPPFLMAGLRFTLAGLALLGWNGWRRRRLPAWRAWKGAAVGGVLMFALGHGGLAWAEQRLPSGMAALILALIPAWVVLVDWLRPQGTRPAAGVFAGLLIGFFGLAMLVSAGQSGQSGLDVPSAAILVGSGFAWAVGTVHTKHAPSSSSASEIASMQLLIGGAILLAAGTLRGDWNRLSTGGLAVESVLALAYLIVFGTLIAFNAYVWLLGVSTPARVATYAYVNPVIAVLLGWAVASEPVTLRTLAAGVVIIAAVVLITKYQARGGPRRSP